MWILVVFLLLSLFQPGKSYGVIVDDLVIDFQNLLQPCEEHSQTPRQQSRAPTGSPVDVERARQRIASREPHHVELELRAVEKFDSFDAYIASSYNLTVDPSLFLSVKTPAELWSPVSRRHRRPHPLFDEKTHETRLTWCDEMDRRVLDKDALRHALRNQRVAFVGDSLTRYQYLNLIDFVAHNEWNKHPHLTNERVSSSWTEFYGMSDTLFRGAELCECYRHKESWGWALSENRRYHSEELNTTIWYFQWFGDNVLPHGHFAMAEDMQPLDCMPSQCRANATTRYWKARTAADFVNDFVLAQVPDVLIVNSGHHARLDGLSELSSRETALFLEYSKAWKTRNLPTRVVFKATTGAQYKSTFYVMRDIDFGAIELALQGVWEYWDVARVIIDLYTAYRKIEIPYVYFHENAVSRGFLWDDMHFTSWVYAELNKLMIVKYIMNHGKDGKSTHGQYH